MIKKILSIFTAFLVLAASSVCSASPYRLISVNHIIEEGDSLNSIAFHYMRLNTYSIRRLEEFKENIRIVNRLESDDLKLGQSLRIVYWVKSD